MNKDQFLNIVAFLILITGGEFTNKSPDYIMEKWDRYIRHAPPDGKGWAWGLDGGNRALLDGYCLRWQIQLDELFPTNDEKGSEL